MWGMSIGETVAVIGGMLAIIGVVFGFLFRCWQVISSYDKVKKSIAAVKKEALEEIEDERDERKHENQRQWEAIRDTNKRIDGLYAAGGAKSHG